MDNGHKNSGGEDGGGVLPIDETAEKLWSLIQRPSPAITKAEILSILREGYAAPTASEGLHPDQRIILEDGCLTVSAVGIRESDGQPHAYLRNQTVVGDEWYPMPTPEQAARLRAAESQWTPEQLQHLRTKEPRA